MKVPKAPVHLSKEAKAWWKKILDEYELPEESLLILQSALESFDRASDARAKIKEHGIVTVSTSKHGTMHRANPAVAIENDAKRVMLACFKQLGLDLEPINPTPGRPAGK